MNWKYLILASALAGFLWLLGAQWWYDIHNTLVIRLEEIIVTPDNSH